MESMIWIEDRAWAVLGEYSSLQCRLLSGHPLTRCPNRAVAELLRVHKVARWWAYCQSHLYGGRLVDDRVEIKVRRDSLDAKRGYVQKIGWSDVRDP